MPENVHAHPLSREGRASGSCVYDISGQPTFESVAAEGTSGPCREQRFRWQTSTLGEPCPEGRDGTGCERRDPLLSPFAGATDMRTGPKMDIGAVQPDQFGGPKARLDGETEQRRVAPPGPGQ